MITDTPPVGDYSRVRLKMPYTTRPHVQLLHVLLLHNRGYLLRVA